MSEQPQLYHSTRKDGYWADTGKYPKDISLTSGTTLEQVIPDRIRQVGDTLALVVKTSEGETAFPIENLPGLKVVRGNSKEHPHEEDGELLIEIHYLKIDQMEDKPRRIRPTGIKFGILGDAEESSFEGGGHRAMGESADYYLEGIDTQYNPEEDSNQGRRYFPFWRIGVYGPSEEQIENFLPEPQSKKSDE